MSVQQTRHETEHRIELPEYVVEAIADDVARREQPTECDVRDSAFERVDRQTEFVTESGEELVAAVADRIDS